MLFRFTNILKTRFVRNVVVLASGTAGAQAITMVFAPFITRIYGAEAFGVLGTFMAAAAILLPLAALSYPVAMVLPEKDSEALALGKLSLSISFFLAAILAIILLLGGETLLYLVGAQELGRLIFLLPLFMLFAAWFQVAQQWLIRKKLFGFSARIAVVHSLLLNSAKVVVGFAYPIAAALIVLSTGGQALYAGLLALGGNLGHSTSSHQRAKFSLLELARRYYDFPLYRAPQSFINAASQGLPVLMLAGFFGPAQAGFYALSRSVLAMPVTLIGKAVGDVFYPRITEAARRQERIAGLIVKTTGALAAIGLLPFGFVFVTGPWLFGLVFGAEWVVAGEYAQWLAVWLYFMFVNQPSVRAIPVLSLQRWLLSFEVVSVCLRAAALSLGFFLFNSAYSAIVMFSLVGAGANIVLIMVTIYFAKTTTRTSRQQTATLM